MKSFGATDKGLRREYNEDYFYISDTQIGCLPNLYVVADGMGGHKAGDVASRQAIKYLTEYIRASSSVDMIEVLKEAVKYANTKVYEEGLANDDLRGMGTTLVVATLVNQMLYVFNVGDSRLYIKGSELIQLTIDHSVVEELYRAGQIADEDRYNHPDKNIITRAIGAEKEVVVDSFTKKIDGNDIILLCSDGVTKMLVDQDINTILLNGNSLKEIGEKLIIESNEQGGHDNITLIIVKHGSEVLV